MRALAVGIHAGGRAVRRHLGAVVRGPPHGSDTLALVHLSDTSTCALFVG